MRPQKQAVRIFLSMVRPALPSTMDQGAKPVLLELPALESRTTLGFLYCMAGVPHHNADHPALTILGDLYRRYAVVRWMAGLWTSWLRPMICKLPSRGFSESGGTGSRYPSAADMGQRGFASIPSGSQPRKRRKLLP